MIYTDMEKLLIEKLTKKTILPRQTEEKILTSFSSSSLSLFFSQGFQELDDTELDIIFSYIFTPTLADKAQFGAYHEITLSEGDIFRLADDIAAKHLFRPVVDNEGNEYPLPLKEVNILRYLKLLHLNREIPEEMIIIIEKNAHAQKDLLVALLRDSAFLFTQPRITMLETLLSAVKKNNLLTAQICNYLIEFIDANQVKNLNDFEYKLFRLHDVYAHEGSKKTFYSEELAGTYGESGGIEPTIDRLRAAKENHKELTSKIKDILGYIHDEMPAAFA